MSNFLSEVLQAKGTTTFEELTKTLESLDNKISQLKITVVQSLTSTFVLYETDLDRVVQWYTEIVGIQNQLETLQDQLRKDEKVLNSANQDLETIVFDLEQCHDSTRLIKSLVDVVRCLERADPIDYYNASKLIKSAEQELSNISCCFPSADDHIWIKQLRARFSDLVVDVYDKSRKEWGNLFKFDKNSLTIYPHATNVGQLVTCLKNIKSFQRIWEKFLNILWQELFKPGCSSDYKIEVVTPKPKRQGQQHENAAGRRKEEDLLNASTLIVSSLGMEEGALSQQGKVVIVARKLDRPCSSATEVLQNITELVKAFNAIFCECESEMAYLAMSLGPKINDELKIYLKTLILQRCGGDVAKARADVAEMGSFQENLANNYNFEFPEGNVFEEIDQNFDRLFQCYIREALIVQIRNLIKYDPHNTAEINHESMPNSMLSADEVVLLRKNPALFPKCVVSKSVAEIISRLKDHMKKYPTDVAMSTNVFSLYLALVKIPKHEADASELVSLTSVLIHNNSLYLAHHAGYTFNACDDMVPDLRAKASQAIAFMMRCVRSKLNELISTAMASIHERVERNIDITHDFLVITAELKRLNTIMDGVLPPLAWHDILATLVDHTVNELCLKVLAWDDIPAESASELASAFTQFAVATSSLFKGDASTPREIEALTSRAVKKWQRFRLLIFVLTSSMKEIESKWVSGCGPLASEFTAEEVRRLVRGLFQNTDRRAAFLATIK